MKRLIKGSQNSSGYRYITKHGIGPGTLPRDVELIDWEDLDNYKTAIYVNRPLSKKELDYYDIYPEWIQESVKASYDDYGYDELPPYDVVESKPGRIVIRMNGHRYRVSYKKVKFGVYADTSRISPYDDADYVWARTEGTITKFIQGGKVIDRMHSDIYDPDDYEDSYGSWDEWATNMFAFIIKYLEEYNSDIKPVMIHN